MKLLKIRSHTGGCFLLALVFFGIAPLAPGASFPDRPSPAYGEMVISNMTILHAGVRERCLAVDRTPPGTDCGDTEPATLDTTLKALVPQFLDDTVPAANGGVPLTVSDLWARLAIGDRISGFSHEMPSGSVGVVLSVADFQERFAVLDALQWTAVPVVYATWYKGASVGWPAQPQGAMLCTERDFWAYAEAVCTQPPGEMTAIQAINNGMFYMYFGFMSSVWGDIIVQAGALPTETECTVEVYDEGGLLTTMGGGGDPVGDYVISYPCPGPWDYPPGDMPPGYIPPPSPPYPPWCDLPAIPGETYTTRGWQTTAWGIAQWLFACPPGP